MTTKALIEKSKEKGFTPLIEIPPRHILPERLELLFLEDLKSWLRESLKVFVHVEPLNGWSEWTVSVFAKTEDEPFARIYIETKETGVERYLYALRIGLTEAIRRINPEGETKKEPTLRVMLKDFDLDSET
jgi:hypothetical protein